MEPRPAALKRVMTSSKRQAEHGGEVIELRRREAVDVDRGMVRADVVQQLEVVVDRELGVMAALHENLRAADRFELGDLRADLLVGSENVVVLVALRAHERAELAVDVADVRVIDVAVDDVGGRSRCLGRRRPDP